MLAWLGYTTLAAAVLAVLVLVACRARRLSPAVEHALWLLVLVKLLTPTWIAWPWSPVELWDRPDRAGPAPVAVTTTDRPQVSRTALGAAHATSPEPAPGAALGAALPTSAGPATEAALRGDLPTSPKPATEGLPDPSGPSWLAWCNERWPEAALVVWALGALVVSSRQVIRGARFRRLVARGVAPPEWFLDELRRTAGHMGMRPPASLAVPGLGCPVVWCFGRAKLLWPEAMAGQSDPARGRGILLHELAHLRRRDHWVLWLETAAAWMWWWNPLFWYVRRRIHRSAERACDAWVVWAMPDGRRRYAESLVEVVERMSQTAPAAPAWGAIGRNRRDFERRLTMIVRGNVPRRVSWVAAIGIGLVAMIALPGWSPGQAPGDAPAGAGGGAVIGEEAGAEGDEAASGGGETVVEAGKTIGVFVALEDIPAGELISADVLKLERWPKDKIPSGAIAELDGVVGRSTQTKIFAGEPIVEGKLLAEGAAFVPAAGAIPPGYRIISVTVDERGKKEGRTADTIRPGDRVDVLALFPVGSPRMPTPSMGSMTVARDVKVLGLTLPWGNPALAGSGAQGFSLLVTPDQAEAVSWATKVGKIQLVKSRPMPESVPKFPGYTGRTTIPTGYRVFTARLDEEAGTGGIIWPGDRVDVVLSSADAPARTILRDVKVFDVDPDAGGPPLTVSLTVTPAQSEILATAAEVGKIQLAKHQPGPEPPPKPLPEPPAKTIEVFRLKHRRPDEMMALVTALMKTFAGEQAPRSDVVTVLAAIRPPVDPPDSPYASTGYKPGTTFGPYSPPSEADWDPYGPPTTPADLHSQEKMETVRALVAALDTPNDDLPGQIEKLEVLRLLRFENRSTQSMISVLSNLGIDVRVTYLPRRQGEAKKTLFGAERGGVLIATGPEGELKEIEKLIRSIDVEVGEGGGYGYEDGGSEDAAPGMGSGYPGMPR
ncbi:MAG: Flp pilus assembly protein CpaB [Planctomycetota bacterium]|jgi:Flp pilus assembly protein CpaB